MMMSLVVVVGVSIAMVGGGWWVRVVAMVVSGRWCVVAMVGGGGWWVMGGGDDGGGAVYSCVFVRALGALEDSPFPGCSAARLRLPATASARNSPAAAPAAPARSAHLLPAPWSTARSPCGTSGESAWV